MPTKIRIKVGNAEVEYEGPESFLNKKLPDLLGKISSVARIPVVAASKPTPGGPGAPGQPGSPGTLASFLKAKNAQRPQTRRFLATARWLQLKGSQRISTRDVSKALSDNSQKRLGNPSDCLKKNVNQGFCEKEGKEFFVTSDGQDELDK